MRDDREEEVGVFLDEIVEAPVLIDAGLKDAACLIVLLGAEGFVSRIGEEKAELLLEVLANARGCGDELPSEPIGASRSHVRVEQHRERGRVPT